MLTFETTPYGPLSCNCTLVWDDETRTGVVIDPSDEAPRIRQRVEALGFRVTALLHTHAHFDHLGASHALQDLWKIPAYLHPGDDPLVANLAMQTSFFGMKPIPAPIMQPLAPGDRHHGLTVIHTPGHSPGGCCFLGQGAQGPFLVAGDTLFQGGVGRTDLFGGDWDTLEASIRQHLYTLDDATRVLPGHGPMTTIGAEARHNPFVRR
ncbi:MAG: MBL fold metallo-hydrolase [Firmicutes bacterium]|nr:MBL fold metallo-hydrolase [Bacillota bacterium]